eukprot:TRINITY_DN626_c1_g1_i6.p1 TRINITY_DN626_c1_g1~~TRINITY_DN626_c1_g1_i6.p1  ORF type:complete len:622 (+),score=189.17 TRINITY_DN626_c1_g1_i6:86-1951(+)
MDSSLSNIVKWVSCESSEPPKVASLLRSQRFSAAEALHAVFSISPPNPDDRKIQTKWENTDALEERESGEVEKTDGGVEEMTKEKEGQEEEEEEEIQKEGQKEGDTGGWVSEYYGRLVDVVHSIISVSPSSFAVDDPVQLHTLLEATRRLDWSGSVVYLWQVLLRECNTMVEKGVLSFVETVDRVPVGKMNLHGLISLLSESMSFLGLLFSEGIVDGKEPKRFELMWEVAKVRAKKGIPCPTEIISRALTMLTNVQSQEAVGHALHIAGVWVHDMQETLFENAFDAFLAVFRRFLPGINTSSAELESFLGPLRWYLHQLYNRSAVDLVDRLKKEHFEPREKPILCMFMQQLIFHPKLVLDDGSDAFVDHADEQDEEHGRTTNYSLVEPPFETALELTDSLSDEQADPLRNAWRNVKTSIVSKFERDEFVKRMRGYRERINELERQLGVRSPRMRVSDAGDIGVLDEEWMKKINALTIECHAKADEIAMLKELLSQKEKQCKAVEAKLKERNTGYSNMKLLLSHAKYQSSSAAARIVASREVQHEISLWEQYHRVMADIHEEDADLREKVIHLGRQLKNQQTYVDGLEKKIRVWLLSLCCTCTCTCGTMFSFICLTFKCFLS